MTYSFFTKQEPARKNKFITEEEKAANQKDLEKADNLLSECSSNIEEAISKLEDVLDIISEIDQLDSSVINQLEKIHNGLSNYESYLNNVSLV